MQKNHMLTPNRTIDPASEPQRVWQSLCQNVDQPKTLENSQKPKIRENKMQRHEIDCLK